MPSIPMPPSYDPFTTLQAAGHDRTALARLAEMEQPGLAAWLERVLRDDDLTQEAVQETWLTLSRGDWSFAARTDDVAGDVRAWLRRIALRAALRLRQRQRTQRRHLDGWCRSRTAPMPAPTPLERLAEQDRRDLVWALVAELPATLREPLELRFRDGLDFAAIGRAQGCTALAARVRTWRALAQMRRRLLVFGILVMPTSLMATLGGGAVAGVAGGALVIGVLPRVLAQITGTAGAPVISLVLGGGMVASVLGWWLLASGGIGADTAYPAPASSRHAATPATRLAEWEIAADPPGIALPAGAVEEMPAITPGASPGQVLIEVLMFAPGDAGLAFDNTRPTVLSAEQRDELMTQVMAQGGEVLAHPDLLLLSGQAGMAQLARQVGYIAGYERSSDGPQPKINVLDDGSAIRMLAMVEADGTRMVKAEAQRGELQGLTQRSARVQSGGGMTRDLTWEEPTVHSSQAIALPRDGILVPHGGSLLLPATSGFIQRGTPGGVANVPDPAFRPWWVLIVPSVVPEQQTQPEGEPTLPSSRS